MPVTPGVFIVIQIVGLLCSLAKWVIILGVAISLANSARRASKSYVKGD